MMEAVHGSTPNAAQPDAPVVFVARSGNALRLAAVDRFAQRQGLAPGLTLADAKARHPDLIMITHDEEADRLWLQRLAAHCQRWSPRVVLVPPDGLTLDITGCEHLHGGEKGMIGTIEDGLARWNMTARLAAASTIEAAQALARYAALPVENEHMALRALPIAALALEADAARALLRAGLKTIGDIAVRPAASIAARFGADAVTALQRLLGEAQAPRIALPPPDPLYFIRRFAEPIAHQAVVAASFAELLHEAAGALEQRHLGGRCFRLTLFRSDGARHQLDIETGQPTRNAGAVLRLFDERVAGLADPLDPGFGYDQITLSILVAEPLPPHQVALDGNDGQTSAFTELIDRLSTRLGRDNLYRLIPHDSHIPERAQRALPTFHGEAPCAWPAPADSEPPLRPAYLFDPPQPVQVMAGVPDGPPRRFRWRGEVHRVALAEGPERIADAWWQRKSGHRAGQTRPTRDYYRIEDENGQRYWLFRHGLYTESADPRWYLHGLFA